VAPAVLNSSLNQQNCLLPPPPGTVSGTELVPTSFGIRLTTTRTGCTVDLPLIRVQQFPLFGPPPGGPNFLGAGCRRLRSRINAHVPFRRSLHPGVPS